MMKPLVADKMMKGCSSEVKILFISTCKEKLSDFEYLMPVIELVKQSLQEKGCESYKIKVLNYREIKKLEKKDLESFNLIVITGTALKDFDYLNYLDDFKILKESKPKKIGICAGAQILAFVYGIKLEKLKNPLIGVFYINGKKHFFLTNFLLNKESVLNFVKKNGGFLRIMLVNSKEFVFYL
jgi:hypothetical protein